MTKGHPKLTFRHFNLSGCCETTANKGGEPRNWPNSWPLREARRGKRMTGQSPSKTHCIDRS